MQQRTIGPFTVSAIGLGAMPVSMNNDNELPDRADAIGTVHAALDAGVTFIDTADIYAPSWDQMGHNERIVRDALASWDGDTSGILVGTKGGITRTADKDFGRDGSLGYLRSAVQRSMENLGVEVIDFYQYHRPDRWMVYGEIMQNLKTLQDEGLVRALGISNASVEEIAIAEQVLGAGNLVSVQNQFSPRYPGSFGELRYCDAHGIALIQKIAEAHPALPCVLMSGLPPELLATRFGLNGQLPHVPLLPKPFSDTQFDDALRAALSSVTSDPA